MGRLDEALEAYDAAVRDFPTEVVPRTGRAEVLKGIGRLDEALEAYDAAVRDFPAEVFARTGRAEVLKAQGRLDDAFDAYNATIQRFPLDSVARVGRLAILVMLGRCDEARQLLPTASPRTSSEWVALHLRGMIHLREGDLPSAASIFRQGVESPFAEHRSYFRTALAVTELRRANWESAADWASNSGDNRPVAHVIRLQCFGELLRSHEAASAYESVRREKDPNVAAVRDELAARYISKPPGHIRKSDDWVFERECWLLMSI
jgi:tetratricopeptide (TPR) repeat protein